MSEFTCIYLVLILHNDEVMVTEDKINAFIKAAHVNADHFWLGLFTKVLVNVNIRSLMYNAGGPAPFSTSAPAEEEEV